MRRRDFIIGLLLAAGARTVQAQERAKQHRIAIVIASGPVARISDPVSRVWEAFWEELRRLGDVEGQNLIVERYSGGGRPEGLRRSRSPGRQPEPGCDRSDWPYHHAGGPCSHRHNTDCRLRGLYRLRSRAEPCAPRAATSPVSPLAWGGGARSMESACRS
jgi:hypothetical protein